MKTFRHIYRFALLGLFSAGLVGAQVETSQAADCYSVGQQIASQKGGQLANVSQGNRGGQPVCVVVVLIPGKDGGRPRREEFVVPAN